MKPCIIGIGGTGGKVLKEFLRNEDIPILGMSLGENIAFGGVKGIWMDFDTNECEKDKFYTGRLENGNYPGFIVPPEVLRNDSQIREYINNKYGYDLRKQGFDRRAEYMKAIFEIFRTDPEAKRLSQVEYSVAENPLLAYIWQRAISKFLTIGKVSGEDAGSNFASQGGMEKSQANDEGQNKTVSIEKPVSKTEMPKEQAGPHHTSQTEQLPSNGKKGDESTKNRLPVGSLPNLLAIDKISSVGSSILSKIKASNGDKGSNKCESLLFIASLGGGTGTGFINPLTNFIRTRGSLFALALCLFTEKGMDNKDTLEEQRDLGAIIAMYDLLTKRRGNDAIDALILIDNQILQSVYGKNYPAMNKAIFEAMRPFVDQRRYPDFDDEALGVQRVFIEGLDLPGVLVPCYFLANSAQITEAELVNSALSKGKLFPCDIKKADEAYIFSRGLLDPSKMENALHDAIGKNKEGKEREVHVYPKIGENNSAEILILLRNPYGGERSNFSRKSCGKICGNEETWKKTVSENFEQRIYCAICMGLRYLKEYEKEIIPSGTKPITKACLGNYLYGQEWVDRNLKLLDEKPILSDEDNEFKQMLEKANNQHLANNVPFLKDELEKALARIELGDTPIFTQELNIFSANKIPDNPTPTPFKLDAMDLNEFQPMIENEVRRILGKIGYLAEGIDGNDPITCRTRKDEIR